MPRPLETSVDSELTVHRVTKEIEDAKPYDGIMPTLTGWCKRYFMDIRRLASVFYLLWAGLWRPLSVVRLHRSEGINSPQQGSASWRASSGSSVRLMRS